MKTYRAPWGTALIITSTLATVLCVGISIGLIGSRHGPWSWLAWLPLVLIGMSALFGIRGYSVTPDALWVQRLFWRTRLPLAGLQSAQWVPQAMQRSLRTFGNGGLFSFTGFYRNRTLGPYRAFVTDLHGTVVLRFPDRTVVVSPAEPASFIKDLETIVAR